MLLLKRVSREIKCSMADFFIVFLCNHIGLSKGDTNSGQFGTETGEACLDKLQNECLISKVTAAKITTSERLKKAFLLSVCVCFYKAHNNSGNHWDSRRHFHASFLHVLTHLLTVLS